IENVTLTSGDHGAVHAGAISGTLGLFGNFALLTGQTSDTLNAFGDHDWLTAGSGASTLAAHGSWNTLIGGAGNDTLIVTGGNSNTIDGGAGFNELDYSAFGSNVVLNLSTGKAQTAPGNPDSFTNIENFVLGSGNDSITGTT